MKLNEWAVHHIRFKDSMKKQIKELKASKDHIEVIEKKETKEYYVTEDINKALDKVSDDQHKQIIITTNTLENVKALIKRWNEVIDKKHVSLIFANTKQNLSWHANPKSHDFVTEKGKLKDSLMSLHESIPASPSKT